MFKLFVSQLLVCLAVVGCSATTTLPVVDLGYVVQQATVNDTGTNPLLTFSNIRYGASPVRFAAPVAPTTINRTVNDGQQNVICPQATPTWELAAYSLANHLTATATATTTAAVTIPTPAFGTSEDCLFLDVVVPEKIYNSDYAKSQRSNLTNCKSTGAPVLVWLYGGGYVEGDKTGAGANDPATLVAKTLADGGEGIIFVAPNYRLGLFGWSASPKFQAQGGISNAGLFDQRLALQWVQKYIPRFGGDPSRVTVIGESAGAGSIMHHITAPSSYNTSSLFTKAIVQSPAFQPITDAQKTTTWVKTLGYASDFAGASITTLAQLRALSFAVLYEANLALVASSDYGTFTFGPVIDGNYVPTFPGQQLLFGAYDHEISVISSHNAYEGTFFTNASIQDNSTFTALVQSLLPQASNATVSYVSNVLYPPIFTGEYPYTTQFERGAIITSDFTITCNSYYLANTFAGTNGKAWKYQFAVPPGYHGIDVAYTFFNGDTSTPSLLDGKTTDATIANVLQKIIGNFVQKGEPGEDFPTYGTGLGRVYDLNITSLGSTVSDADDNARCRYWQSAAWL